MCRYGITFRIIRVTRRYCKARAVGVHWRFWHTTPPRALGKISLRAVYVALDGSWLLGLRWCRGFGVVSDWILRSLEMINRMTVLEFASLTMGSVDFGHDNVGAGK